MENMVVISKDEYKAILELAYKAAMLKEAVLNTVTLDYYGKELYLGGKNDVVTIFKYAFPSEYEGKLRELKKEDDKKKEEDNKEDGE